MYPRFCHFFSPQTSNPTKSYCFKIRSQLQDIVLSGCKPELDYKKKAIQFDFKQFDFKQLALKLFPRLNARSAIQQQHKFSNFLLSSDFDQKLTFCSLSALSLPPLHTQRTHISCPLLSFFFIPEIRCKCKWGDFEVKSRSDTLTPALLANSQMQMWDTLGTLDTGGHQTSTSNIGQQRILWLWHCLANSKPARLTVPC